MTKASKGKMNAIVELSTIMKLHTNAGKSQGFTERGYEYIDQTCLTCGTQGVYGDEWPCATYTAAARAVKDLEHA